jgi:phage-related minor tail protein
MAVTAELVIKATDKASAVFKIIEKAAKAMEKALSGVKEAGANQTFIDIEKAAEDLGTKIDEAEQATKNLGTALVKMKPFGIDAGKMFTEIGEKCQEVGEGFKKIGEAGLGFFEEAVTAAMSFEKSLTKAMSASDATGAKFDHLKEQVGKLSEELSVKFGMSVDDVLNAMYHVQSMGIEPSQKGFEELSEAALKLSKIYGIDLQKSTRAIGIVTSIFGKEMETAGHTANVLFGASQKGKTTVEELMNAMNEGGKAASSMGISMEDTAAILVAFSDKGNMGAKAGTLLRNILLRLTAPPKDAAEALKILNVKVYEGGLKMKDSSKVIEDFGKTFKKLPSAEQKTIMEKLGIDSTVSTPHVKAFHSVMEQVEQKLRYMDEGKKGEILARLGIDAEKSTTKVATFHDKVEMVVKKLVEANATDANKIFDKLKISADKSGPALGNSAKLTEVVTKALKEMKDADAAKVMTDLGISSSTTNPKLKSVTQMAIELGKAINANGKLTAEQAKVFKELNITFERTTTKAKPMKEVLAEINEKLKNGFTPEALKILDQYNVAMFTGAGKMRPMWTILKDLQKATKGLSDEERNRLSKMLAGQRAFAAFGALMKQNLGYYEKLGMTLKEQEKLDKAWAEAQKTLAVQVDRLKAAWHGFMVTVGAPLLKVITPIVQKIVELADAVNKYLAHNPKLIATIAMWGAIGAALAVVFGTILSAVGAVIVGLTGFILSLSTIGPLGLIISAVVAQIGLVIAALMGIVVALGVAWSKNWGGIRTTTMTIIKELSPAFKTFFDELKKLFDEVVATLLPIWTEMWNALKGAFEEFSAFIKPYLPQIWKFVKDTIIGSLKLIIVEMKLFLSMFQTAWIVFGPMIAGPIKFIIALTKAFKENEAAIKLCVDTVVLTMKKMEQGIRLALVAIIAVVDGMTAGALSRLLGMLKTIQGIIDKIRAAQSLANSLNSATKPPSLSGGTSGGSGGGHDTGNGTGSAGGGSNLKKTVIIQGNVYGGPSGARELESILNRATGERLARGMI